MQCLVFIATKLVQHSTSPGRKPPVAVRGAGMFLPSHSSLFQCCCCPYQMQQQQQHTGVSSTSCEPWFSNNSNSPRGRARYGITINGRTVISIKASTHIFMHQQRARVVYTGLETSNTAWVCTLHHVKYMLRVWRPVRWLLCLLLLLLLALPKQQPYLTARASLLYFVSISPNTCLGWLCNSITRRPRAVIAAASIFFVRPSALTTRVAHVSAAEGLLTRELNFLDRRIHQDFFRFPPSQFHTARCRFSLHVASRKSAQHTIAPQTPRSCVGPPREQVVTCCCWYSLAPANYSSDSLLTTAAKRESSCCRMSTAAEHQRRLHAGCPAYFVCKDAGNLMASTVSSPTTASADVHFTRESSSIILECGAFFCVVTSTFSNNHHGVRRKLPGTRGVRKCYYCLGFNPECAFTSFRPRCNTPRDNACAPGIFLDSRTANSYKSRKSGEKYGWQFRSRNLTVPVSKKRGGSPLFVRPSRAAAVSLAGAAPAAPALNSSPTATPPASRAVFTSAGRGPAAATADGPAAGGKRPFPAAAVKGVLSAPSAVQPPISCCSKAAVRVIRGAERDAPAPSFHAAAAKIAVPLAGGSAAGRPKMPVSITAATEAPESIPATSCTSSSTQTQLHSDTASPLPPGTASYPFTRIEEKWVRYYAEHSDDFSPPLPCSGRAADTNVFTADHSRLSSSFPTPAAPCITGSFVNKDEFAPEGSQARKSCENPYVCSNSPSQPSSTKLAEDVDLHTPSPTKASQPFHLHSQEISKTAEVAAEIAGLDREHVNEARKMGALHLGCPRKAVESAERHAEFAKEAPALDSQLSVKIPRTAALCVRETHGQHHTSKRIQSEAVTSVTTDAGYATSWKRRLESAQHTDIPGQRQRSLERASTPARKRKPEKKPAIPPSAAELRRPGAVFLQNTENKPVAEASAPPEAAPKEQERKKYYVLSMIPYPSGEGLHVGHCLTYTVADVVARYRRLQLRGELLRSQNSRKGGRATSLDREDEEGEQQQVKQQRRREDEEEELNKRAANMFVKEPTNERDGLTCDPSIERRSCEQGLRDKDEAFRPDTPVQAVVAHVTENASAPKDSQHSQPTCGFGRPPRTGGEEEGRALLTQRQRETQQVVPRAPQRPDVMHVMGWDAFGLPAEQHALVSGIPPRLSVRKNIETFRRQLQRLGLSVDWRREIDTSDPKYFRWTQWMFLQMWKRGLVYEKAASVNWCEALGTVLADEEVVNGVSTRGQHPVEKKCLEQWHLRITAYADELENSLHSLDWPEDVKVMQRNWIGKRELLCLHLPLLRPPVAARKRSIARERREGNCQAADEHVVHTAGKSGICRSRLRSTSYACDVGRSEKFSSQNGQASCRSSSPPSQADQVRYGAEVPSTTEHAGSTSYSGKADREPHSLRCVSVSPEFLFGVTFVVMHAAHKQAYAAAVTAAARGWLSAQNREATIGGDWQAASAVHAEANELPSRLNRSPPTGEQTGANLAEARILRGTQSEAAVERQHEDVVTERNECVQVLKVRNTYLGKESVFSGSYVKHPLTEAALPVWLFSEKLFHQLKGAGTYFNECDAILVAPEQDSIARTFARAAGLPIISVLASGTDKKGASTVKTQTAGGSELVRQQRHHAHPNEDAGEAVDRPVQDVVVNSHSEKLTVNESIPVRARRQILEHLVARKTGEQQSVFALRDWVFSRQRFWGEPIPLIRAYAEDEEPFVLAESEANLPVILPEKMYRRRVGTHKRYRSSSDTVPPTVSPASSSGEDTWSKNLRHAEDIHSCERLVSAEDDRNRYLQRGSLMAPLADYPEWWDLTPRTIPNTTTAVIRSSQRAGEDVAGLETEIGTGKAEKKQRMIKLQREVSTMPQWAGSSWYFLRFLDPHNTHVAFDKESARYWMPVDLYVGGKEHAVTHLLYARFWHKVLRDIGLVTCGEPFKRLCTPGIMLGTPQYVAFQRLDTREWVSASSVSLKKGNVLESHISQGPRAKQSVSPGTARSTTSFEVARPLRIQPDHDGDPLSNAKSVVTTSVDVSRTDKGAAGIFQGPRAKSTSQQYTVAGIHSPSGQPVREVKIDNAAVTRAKGSDVLVLKEDESIEVMCRYEKMSKSRGNVISPDSLIQAYGADALRLHLLFMGPVEARKIWSLDGIKGVSRFLNRVWHLVTLGSETSVPQVGRGARVPAEDSSSFLKDLAANVGVNQFLGTKYPGGTHNEHSVECTGGHALPMASHSRTLPSADCPEDEQATSFPRKNDNCSQLRNSELSLFEKTLLKQLTERVTRHVERLALNRALAALMCAVKKLNQWKVEGNALSVHSALILVRLLHPFAPFITEELWFRIHKRFPNVARYASSPSLLACGIWPSIQDPEFDTYESAKDESNTARKWGTHVGTEAGSEPAVDVAVHFDGKFHVKVQVPAVFVNDKNALEAYVKRDIRVAKYCGDKKMLRAIVLLKAKLINFVTAHVNSSDDEWKKQN